MPRLLLITLLASVIACVVVGIGSQGNETELLTDSGDVAPILWRISTGGPIVADPIVDEDAILVQSTEGVEKYSAVDGALLWVSEFPADPEYTSLTLHNDLVFSATARSCVSALSPTSGSLIWNTCPKDPSQGEKWSPDGIPITSILTLGERIFVTRFNWKMTAYETGSGDVSWSQPVTNRRLVNTSVCGIYICLDTGDRIELLNPNDGILQETIGLEREVGPISSAGGLIVAVYGPDASSIVAVRVDNLQKIWDVDLSRNNIREIQNIALSESQILVSGDGIASLDSRDGQLNWAQSSNGSLGQPLVAGDTVIVKDQHERLLAFDRETGFVTNVLSPQPGLLLPRSFWPDPVTYGHSLLVPLRSGELIAIRLETLAINFRQPTDLLPLADVR